jgi:type IV pilus assembly protein PilW
MLTPHPARRRTGQYGLSIVELLVGVAVGLFIVGGATKLLVDNLVNNRRMLVETRVNQDLRAAADLIVRDLRRAGYWRNAAAGVSSDPAVAAAINPYRAVAYNGGTGELTYSYAKDNVDTLDNTTEGFGVRRGVDGATGRGVIQLRTGNAWQTITDPGTLEIPTAGDLSITASATRTVELWDSCPCLAALGCTATQFTDPDPTIGIHRANRPRMDIRQYTLVLNGRAVNDSRIRRQITETVRVRNDEVTGACP